MKIPIKSRRMLPKYSDEELTSLAVAIGLTLVQLKELHRACHATYQEIGEDLSGGKSIRRVDLVEVVLDACYLTRYGWNEPTPAPCTCDEGLTPNLAHCRDLEPGISRWRHGQEYLGVPTFFKTWLKEMPSKYALDDIYGAVAAGFPFPVYE